MKHVALQLVIDTMSEMQKERYMELLKNFSKNGLRVLMMLTHFGVNEDGSPMVCYKLIIYLESIKVAEEPRLFDIETILDTLSNFLKGYKIIDIEG
jgi:hypothetical protein